MTGEDKISWTKKGRSGAGALVAAYSLADVRHLRWGGRRYYLHREGGGQ